MDKRHKHDKSIIIITSGFEEESTVVCLKRFRSAGLNVKLVGLTARPVVGAHGLVVRPDCSLEQLDDNGEPRLIVIPGYEKSVEKLLADPRFHRLFEATVANDGRIGIMRTAEAAFGQAGLIDLLAAPHCLRQGTMDAVSFSRDLAAAVSAA